MYVVGACLYMARVPERFAPGRFDYIVSCSNSSQSGPSMRCADVDAQWIWFSHCLALDLFRARRELRIRCESSRLLSSRLIALKKGSLMHLYRSPPPTPLRTSFHIFILCAAFAHYISIRRAYAFWHTVQALGGEAGRGAVCAALEGMRR